MADKVIKQTLLKFYDNMRDKNAASVLDEQVNASEFLRQLLADYKAGAVIECTAFIEDAIALLESLSDGSTDVLFEMFPDLEAQLKPDSSAPPPIKDDGGKYVSQQDFDILKQLVHSLIRDKETNYQMVEQPLPVKMTPPTAPAFSGTKPISTTNGKSDGSAADNLLDSLNNF